jgi:CheY-like chemotaxis protein
MTRSFDNGRAQPAGSGEAVPGKKSPAGGYILVAEDQEINRVILTHLLKRLGYRVIVAQDGKEAVLRWQEGGFDLILMDIHMPVIDGLEATAIIRRLEADQSRYTPIIACTAEFSEAFEGEHICLGFDGLVRKPLDIAMLQSEIERCLPLRRSGNR